MGIKMSLIEAPGRKNIKNVALRASLSTSKTQIWWLGLL